jgi:predicted alpha/beta hydrolase family esterase
MKRNKKLKTIFFAHSAGPQYGEGKGSYDLVKYLRSKLSGEYRILFPKIKKPGAPAYAKFKEMFSASFKNISSPVILIGHSLGASMLLKFLSEEKPGISVAALFLVSTPHWKSNMKEFELKDNFQNNLKDIPAIFLYHSKNDEEAPIESLAFYEKAFKTATVHKLPGKEHTFSKGLPKLVADILTSGKKSKKNE